MKNLDDELRIPLDVSFVLKFDEMLRLGDFDCKAC